MNTITYKGRELTLVREIGNATQHYLGLLFTDGDIIVKFEYWPTVLYGDMPEPEIEISEIKLMAGDIRALSAFYAREAAKEVV